MKLIAIAGDLAAGGMTSIAATLEVSSRQAKIIFDWQEQTAKCSDALDGTDQSIARAEYAKMKELEGKINCFPNKWAYRSTWAKA
jgi:hypothetical protein